MGSTAWGGQGGRPSAGIMTERHVAIAPLDATLLAVAGGILLAWWLPLPLWSLPCAPSVRFWGSAKDSPGGYPCHCGACPAPWCCWPTA